MSIQIVDGQLVASTVVDAVDEKQLDNAAKMVKRNIGSIKKAISDVSFLATKLGPEFRPNLDQAAADLKKSLSSVKKVFSQTNGSAM